MSALTSWLIYGLPSLAVGLLVGRLTARQAVVEALDIEHVHESREAPVHKPKRSTMRKVGAAIVAVYVLSLTGYAAWSVTSSNDATESLARENERQQACTTAVLRQIVEAQEESAALTAQVSQALRAYVDAAVEGKQALADLATLIVDPGVSQEAVIAALDRVAATTRDAGAIGSDYVELSSALAKIRREHPVPSVDAIEACR